MKSFVLVIMLCTIVGIGAQEELLHFSKDDREHTATPLYIGIIGELNDVHHQIVTRIKNNIATSTQFTVECRKREPITHKRELTELFDRGYLLVLFITCSAETISWRLYDVYNAEMMQGKRYELTAEIDSIHWGDRLAHDMWYGLTGHESPFMSSIAFVKKIKKGRSHSSQLWVSSYDGKAQKLLYNSPRILISPSWNKDASTPQIVFSEFTSSNVRLCAVDMSGKSKVVLDLEGTCVGISYAPDNNDVIYCRSGQIWHFHYDCEQRKGIHTLAIASHEPCACPILLENGDIIFCSAGKIYYFEKKSGEKRALTTGYSVGPSYSPHNKALVYSKRVNGSMQLYRLDLAHNAEKQLTIGKGDKIDPCWSPCGTYVVFAQESKGKSQIMTLNCETGSISAITALQDDAAYPAWSPSHQGWI